MQAAAVGGAPLARDLSKRDLFCLRDLSLWLSLRAGRQAAAVGGAPLLVRPAHLPPRLLRRPLHLQGAWQPRVSVCVCVYVGGFGGVGFDLLTSLPVSFVDLYMSKARVCACAARELVQMMAFQMMRFQLFEGAGRD